MNQGSGHLKGAAKKALQGSKTETEVLLDGARDELEDILKLVPDGAYLSRILLKKTRE